MTLRTHDSSKLRTTTEAQGAGIQGDVTVSVSVAATLTRERTIYTDIRTRVYPAATLEYSEPGIGDIVLTGIDSHLWNPSSTGWYHYHNLHRIF